MFAIKMKENQIIFVTFFITYQAHISMYIREILVYLLDLGVIFL